MSRPLANKLAIVTGASRGIGRGISAALAGKGANVVLAYTSSSSSKPTQDLADNLTKQHSIRAIPVQADLSKPTGPASLVSEVVKQFPSPTQIDIIVNNAGMGGITPIEDTTVEIFEKIYAINVLGPLLLMQAAMPYLPHDRSGRIVNLGSVSSTLGFKGQSIYGGSKAAVEAMTRTWARELSERATVNSIIPGPVRTEMYASNTDEFKRLIKPFIEHAPLHAVREGVDSKQDIEDAKTSGGRPAEPEEIAGVVSMLCLPESGWVTGQVVSANGGMIFGLQ